MGFYSYGLSELFFWIFKVIETLIVKDYTNEILKFETIFIWIIYKNLLMTFMSVIST
jgi:hypothetical protein